MTIPTISSPQTIPLEELDDSRLRELIATNGVDVATKILFEAVSNSDQHGPAIREIDRLCASPIAANNRPSPIQVAIVPGFLHREYPASGADGRMLIEAAEKLKLPCRTIDVVSTGGLHQNREIILRWLKQNTQTPTVLASISKGGSDIVAALQHPDAGDAFQNVVGWVDVCGIIRGSPVVDHISSTWLPMLGFRALFALRRWRFASVLELRHSGGMLAAGFQPPKHLKIVHVVGFPQKDDFVHPRLRSFHQLIGSLGPNDGAILLRDTIQAPGVVYPVWGADHYMRPRFRTQQLCQGLLQYVSS